MAVDEAEAAEPKHEAVRAPPPEDEPVIKIQQKVQTPSIEIESEPAEQAAGAEAAAPAAARGGVVVRATPAREPPRPGVKVFTVNKLPTKLARAAAPAQLRKILDPQDMQIKYVQLPPEQTTVTAPVKSPMKAKARAAVAGGAGAAGAGAAGGRGGVKIIMNKASFSKLVATAARAHSSGDNEPLAPLSAGGDAVVCVPEQFVRSMSARYLRAQLLAAHAALAAMSRELRAARRGRS